tara:strand:- start:281 stop:580 length:300 start_codon:yes stop_codon:yes gene_type:complete
MSEDRKMGMDKRFLNSSPHETGYVCWAVGLSVDNYDYRRVTCDLKIADCTDQIILDFACYKAEDIPKRIEKVDALIDSLQKLRASLVECDAVVHRMELK